MAEPDIEYHWMQTNTGLRFNFLSPQSEQINLHDIAHALSMKCRYSGQCDRFYSVAEHCVHLVNLVQDITGCNDCCRDFYFLMHDAAEAYLPDIIRGWKKFIKVKLFDELVDFSYIEDKTLKAIYESFNLDYQEFYDKYEEQLKEFDARILIDETRDNYRNAEAWKVHDHYTALSRDRILHCLPPESAKTLFLGLFGTIYSQVIVEKGIVQCRQL